MSLKQMPHLYPFDCQTISMSCHSESLQFSNQLPFMKTKKLNLVSLLKMPILQFYELFTHIISSTLRAPVILPKLSSSFLVTLMESAMLFYQSALMLLNIMFCCPNSSIHSNGFLVRMFSAAWPYPTVFPQCLPKCKSHWITTSIILVFYSTQSSAIRLIVLQLIIELLLQFQAR